MDTDAQLFHTQEPTKILEKQDETKKTKYLANCLAQRKEFTLLVLSVDGL